MPLLTLQRLKVEHPCPVSVNSIELRTNVDWFKEQQQEEEDKEVAVDLI